MKVLVDTNVVMDALLGRDPYFEDSNRVLQICGDKKAEGYLAAHTITNLFYYLRKHYQNEDCRDILLNLFEIFEIEQIDSAKLKTALDKSKRTVYTISIENNVHRLMKEEKIWPEIKSSIMQR